MRVLGDRGAVYLVKLQAWACSVRVGSSGTCSTRVENAEPALEALPCFCSVRGRGKGEGDVYSVRCSAEA